MCAMVRASTLRGSDLPHIGGRGVSRLAPARPRPPAVLDQAALTSIIFGVATCGTGTRTSSMLFCVLRLHVGDIGALGERESPLERAVRELPEEVVLARGVVIGLALALNGDVDPPSSRRKPRCDTLSGLVRGAVEEPRQQRVEVVVEVELPSCGPAKHGGHSALEDWLWIRLPRRSWRRWQAIPSVRVAV
jgi:hypothetical protein